ncbi:GNAT family N-acetyltransferase [Sphingobium phenoxybenzoativorans]|nr:GNAT family N-acetyltransferase [Sphingobium phenoxybenzoativorans]
MRAAKIPALSRKAQPHLFNRIAWLEPLHRLCMPDSAPHILTAADGKARAWLFLAESGKNKRVAIANWYSFAFEPVFAGNPSPEQKLRLMEGIARDLLPDAAQLDVYPVTADDGASALFLKAFRKAGWIAVERPMGVNHYLTVDNRDFETYWAGRPGKLRSTVRRKLRSTSLTFEIHHKLTNRLWDDYITVYQRSWKQSEPNLDFLRLIAEQEGKAGTLRLGFAREDGFPIAVQFWTIENGVALIHKLAHDQGADEMSPGTLLSHHMFRSAIDEDKAAIIDYGTGDNPYKTEWMERQRPLYRVDCFNPRFSSAWLPAAKTAISKLVG